MWNVTTQELYVVRNTYHLLPIIFQLFVVVGLTIFMALYVGIQSSIFHFSTPENNLEPVRKTYPPKALSLLFVVLGCLYPFLHLTFIAFYFHGVGVVQTINALLYEVKKKQPKTKNSFKKPLPVLIREDILGFIIYCSVYFLFFIVIAVTFTFFAKLDAVYYFVKWTLHYAALSDESIFLLETICIPVRVIMVFILSREAARLFPITLAMLYLLLQSLKDTLHALQDSANLQTW